MPKNPLPPTAASNVNYGTLQRANMDVPGKQNRAQNQKDVAAQPGAGKSAMQINGPDWGESSNRNQYQGSPQGEQKEDGVVLEEKKSDGLILLKPEFFKNSIAAIPDINTLFQSLVTSGRKLVHFFVPFIES